MELSEGMGNLHLRGGRGLWYKGDGWAPEIGKENVQYGVGEGGWG